MANITALEAQVVAEYGKILGWVKNNTTITLVIGIVVAYFLGAVTKGWPL